MADSMSVKAILSAVDRGFKSTFERAMGTANTFEGKMKGGLGSGIMAKVGQQAFSMLVDGAKGLITEIDSSNAAWKTFVGNMKMTGKSFKEIGKIKKELQSFAEQTIYSSSDMTSTFAQLEAVGTKKTTKLVKGFSGLAAAAENPQQAIKTLSIQATQMAVKPTVAWEDFKLMLKQTPSGIAAVAKYMGKTTSELVKSVQNGELATDDFFAAIERVGNSEGFMKMAAQYKTMGQAMGDLQETLGNKLGPAFEVVSQKGIGAIGGIIDEIGKLDGNKIADKVSAGLEAAKPYWDTFKKVVLLTGKAIKIAGGFLTDYASVITKVIPVVLSFVGAYKGFKIVSKVVLGVQAFTRAVLPLTGKKVKDVPKKLTETSKAQKAVGKESGKSAISILKMAVGILAIGAGVLLAGTGLFLMAKAAIALADSGWQAIAVMGGMMLALAGLALGASMIGTALTAGAIGFVAFGAAVLMVATGIYIVSKAAPALADALSTVVGAATDFAKVLGDVFEQLGNAISMVVDSIGRAISGVVDSIGNAITGVINSITNFIDTLSTNAGKILTCFLPMTGVIGAAGLAAGIAAVGFGLLTIPMGLLAGTLLIVNSRMKTIAGNAQKAKNSLSKMKTSVNIVKDGLSVLGDKAKSAMSKLTSAFDNATGKAKSSGQKLGTGFTNGMKGGLNKAPSTATHAINSVVSKLRAGRSRVYSAGSYISQGFAAGMRSSLGEIRSAAQEMAKAADKAVRAKAEIKSPSKVAKRDGAYWGDGWVGGILSRVRDARKAAQELVQMPRSITSPKLSLSFATGYNGSLDTDNYEYYRSAEYTIVVPVEVDGKEVAKVTAPYTEAELNKRQQRSDRSRGVR